MGRPVIGYEANLRSKFTQGDEGACWVWAGYKPETHYANFIFKVDGRSKSKTAHRAVYELLIAPIPDGMVLDHLCKNIHCVNPAHLEPVTQKENLRRSDNYIGKNARKTHCVNGHEFTPENIYHPPKKPTHRYCRACANARAKQYANLRG